VPDQNRRTAEDNKEAGPRFPLYNKGPERADIVILVATQEELRQLGKAWPLSWSNAGDREFSYSFAKTELCGYEITVVKAKQGRMGMVDAATLTTQAIHALSPKLIAMTGICAGVGGDVSRGDLIVAAQAYDYGSGKLFPEGPQPDYNFVPMNATLGGDLEQFWETNEEALRKVQDAWPGGNTGKPPTMLRAHAGNIGSGAGVLANESIVQGIQSRDRALRGIDMEAYGIARAAVLACPPVPFIVVKGVQDFGDHLHTDQHEPFGDYAAFVSAKFLLEFLKSYWGRFVGVIHGEDRLASGKAG